MIRITTSVQQDKLTGECWPVQMMGIGACLTCKYKNKPRLCGGKKIRETLMNSKGNNVPVGTDVKVTKHDTIEDALKGL